jgi:S-adenosylmethionine:tRNA ribosyltransferase-isomerase
VLTSDFYYELPPELIAQKPAVPRDSCRLLVLDRKSGLCEHRQFFEIGAYLRPGDLLVANETRVMPARLIGYREQGGGEAEVMLLGRAPMSGAQDELWEALVRPGRRLKPGTRVIFGPDLSAEIIDWGAEGQRGMRLVRLTPAPDTTLRDALHAIGRLPLPPYITHFSGDEELYQTVYSRAERSAAAPTAGLHFTPELLTNLQAAGVGFATIELQVGLDTFRTIEEVRPEEHHIHTERYSVSDATIAAIEEAHACGGRIIAVGTTSVRALESAWSTQEGRLRPRLEEQTALYIMPGYRFTVVDALITNFHVPRSTLLLLVSAFASRKAVLAAYRQAVEERYRFLSFGDAMLIQ